MQHRNSHHPCPACSGRGFFSSTQRRYRPQCHACRGTGEIYRSAMGNRAIYYAQHARDLKGALISLWEITRNAEAEYRASALSQS